jgi:hypothetical protein
MSLFLKRILLALSLILLTHTTKAFSLLGPFDSWQAANLGYNPFGGDLGGPKNLGEEWRWTTPIITYAFEESFINWFGTNGIRAVESAIGAYTNKLWTNISRINLLQQPLKTKRIHPTAQALGLLDLKSETMSLLAEQLGLASAERWVWALRARTVQNNITNYLVIPRNFDPFTLKPTPYVNGVRFSYNISEFAAANFTGLEFYDAVEFLVDVTQAGNAGSVSGNVGFAPFLGIGAPLLPGEYFTGLTRDDIGGLKYIYSENNINTEITAAGTTFLTVDSNTVQFVQGIDLFTFISNSVFTNPTNLLAQFPALILITNTVGTTSIFTTNIFITNLVATAPFLDVSQPILITNRDLFTFSEQSRTNGPNALRNLYPNLIFTSTNSSFVNQITPVLTLTNLPWSAPGDPPQVVTTFVTNLVTQFQYTFANIVTNYASAVTDLELWNVSLAPYATPTDLILFTNRVVTRVPKTSGGFYIFDRATNNSLVGYAFTNQFGAPNPTSTTLVVNTNLTSANPLTGEFTASVNIFTNTVYAAYPIFINASLGPQLVTNVTLTLAPRFTSTFGNITVFPAPGTNQGQLLRTITYLPPALPVQTEVFVPSAFPEGTVLILDTNQFRLIPGAEIRTTGFVTNTLIAFTNAQTGAFIIQELVRQTNGILFAVNPIIQVNATAAALRPGVNAIRFVPVVHTDFFGQTNYFQTNFYQSIIITNGIAFTNTFRRVGPADIVFRAADNQITGGIPAPLMVARFTGFPLNAPPPGQGPGVITPPTQITYTKLVPSKFNSNPGGTDELNSSDWETWGSFDGTTIVPRIYPEDIQTQVTLEDIALGRIR